MDHRGVESPTRTDPVVATLSEVVGGPVGDHAGGHPRWSAVRVLLGATSVVLAAGMLTKSACVPSGWSRPDQPFTQLCWTDLAGRSTGGSPPQVATLLTELADALPGSGAVATTAALVVLLAPLALLATALLVRVDVRRPWAAAGWALGPVLLVHWLSWELVAAAGLAVALWAWTSGRAWLAGLAAGVAAVFALPAALALVGLVAVRGRLRERVDALLAAAAAYVVLTLPGRAEADDPGTGTVWLLLEQAGADPSRTARLLTQGVVLALAALAVWWLVRRARVVTARTCAAAALVLLAAGLAMTAAAPPEQALLLLPLAALALRRWRDLLVWQGLHLVAWVITGWYVGQAIVPTVDGDERAHWLAVALRLAGLAWLVVSVLRDASVDDDALDVGRGEPDPHVDLLADTWDPRA